MKEALVTVVPLLLITLLIDLSTSSWVTGHNLPVFSRYYYHEGLWVVGTRGGSNDGGGSSSDELFQPPVQSSSSIIMDKQLENKENECNNVIHTTTTRKEQEEPTANGPFHVTSKTHNAAANDGQPTPSVQLGQTSSSTSSRCSIVDIKVNEKYICNKRCPNHHTFAFVLFLKVVPTTADLGLSLPSNLVPAALVATP